MNLVIVTGASKGLGLSICKNLLKNNYKIIAISRTKSKQFIELMEKYNEQLFFKEYDFNDIENIKHLVKDIKKEFGTIYGLINNAAVGFDGVLGTMHESDISQLIRVNTEAPIILTKYISRAMLVKQKGRIINISSIIASTGFNGLSVYAATKAALSGFTKSLCRELGKANITVNTISPGYMSTDMTSSLQGDKLETIKRRSPLGDLAQVEDVASMVNYILSPDAKNITGANFTIDAGSTA